MDTRLNADNNKDTAQQNPPDWLAVTPSSSSPGMRIKLSKAIMTSSNVYLSNPSTKG